MVFSKTNLFSYLCDMWPSSQSRMPYGEDPVSSPSSEPIDIESLMNRIKEQIHAELARTADRMPRRAPSAARANKGDTSPVLYAEELNYLNAHWRPWAVRTTLSTHRPLVGRIFLKFKEYLLHLVWDIFFAEYFRREEEYQRNLVRYLNKVARYIDARDGEIFWSLVQKVDNDVRSVHERNDCLYDELAIALERLETRLEALERADKR